MLVEDVVHFGGDAQRRFFERDVFRERHIVRIPRPRVVFGDVRDGFVAFSGVKEAVIQIPSPVAEIQYGGTGYRGFGRRTIRSSGR